jgi:DNA-binding beta-propeller fold protein YncE
MSKNKFIIAVSALALIATTAAGAFQQGRGPAAPVDPMKWGTPTNDLPNPYRTIADWAKLPEGRIWGSTAGVSVDPKGNIWVAERCAQAYPGTCSGSKLAPIFQFDPSGKLLIAFGANMFVFPHGITADSEGNIWVTDEQGETGKGYQAFKFSPAGKVLMTLGKAGVQGSGPDTFDGPKAVAIAENGDIFVADGGRGSARIVKFDKTGKFLLQFSKQGSEPGDLSTPHCLAFDSQGRLFVGDRGNNRVQIFDQQGKFIAAWTQFSRPSGIFIDKRDDTLYVADSESGGVAADHGAWRRGIRIGSAKDGSLKYFIPDPNQEPNYRGSSAAEGVAVDLQGVVYGAEVGQRDLKKYIRNN